MVNFNRLAIMAVMAVSLVALCGAASADTAPDITVSIDHVQINGHYDGSMTLLNNVPGYYGYEYDMFVPDGTYTVFGTITNNEDEAYDIWVGDTANRYTLKKNSELDVQYTYAAATPYITVNGGLVGSKKTHSFTIPADCDVVNEDDTTVHTWDQGPMSNMAVIFSNGFTNSEMPILFSANQSDINQVYPSSGHFNFGNSSLYSFLN
jgi:hypothetical protein